MTQHTPGPWYFDANTFDELDVIVQNKYKTIIIADCCGLLNLSPPLQEAIANARLIAAAPELLEALRKVVNMHCVKLPVPGGEVIYSYRDYTGVMDKARAAIAKAEAVTRS